MPHSEQLCIWGVDVFFDVVGRRRARPISSRPLASLLLFVHHARAVQADLHAARPFLVGKPRVSPKNQYCYHWRREGQGFSGGEEGIGVASASREPVPHGAGVRCLLAEQAQMGVDNLQQTMALSGGEKMITGHFYQFEFTASEFAPIDHAFKEIGRAHV